MVCKNETHFWDGGDITSNLNLIGWKTCLVTNYAFRLGVWTAGFPVPLENWKLCFLF